MLPLIFDQLPKSGFYLLGVRVLNHILIHSPVFLGKFVGLQMVVNQSDCVIIHCQHIFDGTIVCTFIINGRYWKYGIFRKTGKLYVASVLSANGIIGICFQCFLMSASVRYFLFCAALYSCKQIISALLLTRYDKIGFFPSFFSKLLKFITL